LRKDERVSHLEEVVLDLERHSAEGGWDAPPRLYALVETAELRSQDPELADELGIPADVDSIAALEQPPLAGDGAIEDQLGTIAWPEAVAGCALVVERIVLPPEAEAEMPDEDVEAWVAEHPQREDVRVVVGVLRDGSRHSALRLRKHDSPDEVISAPNLVPALADALTETLEPDMPPAALTEPPAAVTEPPSILEKALADFAQPPDEQDEPPVASDEPPSEPDESDGDHDGLGRWYDPEVLRGDGQRPNGKS
jgi:hypothetical protein